MRIGRLKISVVDDSGVSGAAVATQEDAAESNGGLRSELGGGREGTFLGIRQLRSRLQSLLSNQSVRPVDEGLGRLMLDPDSPLYLSLTDDLQAQSLAHPHMWDYLSELPMDEIGIPQYHSQLSTGLATQEYRNIIYPVSEGIFIHLHPDPRDSRDFYFTIEPSLSPNVPELMSQVDQLLTKFVKDLKAANYSNGNSEVLLGILERICSVEGGIRNRKAIKVTQEELEGLRYLMVRDKEGLGVIEPLIMDPYIEDISCSGVGPLFVEHKIFGGLKSGVSFDTEAELDSFVVGLSEKIGRPVTVRDPIVDAVLPDGSRVNIVFGNDVSKRGM